MATSSSCLLVHVVAVCATILLVSVAGVRSSLADSREHSLESAHIWQDLGFDMQPDGPRNANLTCPDGTLAIGLTYNKGSTVDSITLHCKVPQFAGEFFWTWSADTVYQAVWAGGPGGKPHDLFCPEGMVIAGSHGVNKNWQPNGSLIYAQPQWLLASISIECAKLIQSAPWRVAHFAHGSAGTALAMGTRTNLFAHDDLDNYNSGGPFIITSDPRKNNFVQHCVDTPLAGYEIAFGQWKQVLGDWVPVIQAVKWHCF